MKKLALCLLLLSSQAYSYTQCVGMSMDNNQSTPIVVIVNDAKTELIIFGDKHKIIKINPKKTLMATETFTKGNGVKARFGLSLEEGKEIIILYNPVNFKPTSYAELTCTEKP